MPLHSVYHAWTQVYAIKDHHDSSGITPRSTYLISRDDSVEVDPHRSFLLGFVSALFVLTLSITSCRFWIRWKVHRKLLLDDWVMFLPLACRIAVLILLYIMYLTTSMKTRVECVFLWAMFTTLLYMTARVSGAIMLCRIFSSMMITKYYIISLTVIQLLVGIIFMIIEYGNLWPLAANWDPSIQGRPGIPEDWYYPALKVYLITFCWADLTYVLVPSIVAHKFKLSFGRRLGIGFLLVLSALAFGLNIYQIWWTISNTTESQPEWEYELNSTVREDLDIIIPSLVALMPITKLDYPIVKFFRRRIDSLEKRWDSIFGSKIQELELPSFVAEARRDQPQKVATIGSRPLNRLQQDSLLTSSLGDDSGCDIKQGAEVEVITEFESSSSEEGNSRENLQC